MPTVLRCALDRETQPAEFDERNRGTYGLRYLVTTDGKMSSRKVANLATLVGPHPLPLLWSTFSYLGDTDPYSYSRHYRVNPKSFTLYEIDVQYRPLDPGELPGKSNIDPLLRPAELAWDSEVHNALYFKDRNGNNIVNKVGKRPDDPVELEETRGVLVVRFNVANLAAVIAHNRTFEMATNSSIFTIGSVVIGPRQALCRSVASERQTTESNQTFYTEIYRIAIKGTNEVVPTWDEDLLEQGYQYWKKDSQGQYLDSNDGSSNFIRIENGRALFDAGPEPARLKLDGTLLEDDQPGVFTKWEVRRQADFNLMPFMPLS